jgi:rare lipoprotein A
MPTPQSRRWSWRAVAIAVLALLSLGGFAYSMATRGVEPKIPLPTTEGNAVWYAVPPDSLAKKRAGKEELTAAHNKLPLGTRVRVTNLTNNRNVIVRVTDRGITKRHAIIDLCREAAEQLDMLRQGEARVRLEVLPDDQKDEAKP